MHASGAAPTPDNAHYVNPAPGVGSRGSGREHREGVAHRLGDLHGERVGHLRQALDPDAGVAVQFWLRPRARSERCLCQDSDFVKAYRAKWG